jgi:hypothetical protein
VVLQREVGCLIALLQHGSLFLRPDLALAEHSPLV